MAVDPITLFIVGSSLASGFFKFLGAGEKAKLGAAAIETQKEQFGQLLGQRQEEAAEQKRQFGITAGTKFRGNLLQDLFSRPALIRGIKKARGADAKRRASLKAKGIGG